MWEQLPLRDIHLALTVFVERREVFLRRTAACVGRIIEQFSRAKHFRCATLYNEEGDECKAFEVLVRRLTSTFDEDGFLERRLERHISPIFLHI